MASVPSSPVVAESGWPSGPRTGLPSWPYSVNVAPASGLPVTESTLEGDRAHLQRVGDGDGGVTPARNIGEGHRAVGRQGVVPRAFDSWRV